MADAGRIAAVLVGSYLLGGIPFGLLVGKVACGIDVRRHGSRNIGSTNVLRLCGWRAALVVFAADTAKGAVAVVMGRAVLQPTVGLDTLGWWAMGAGLASVAGHTFPPYIGFRGGRGVATGLGVTIGLSWQIALAAFGIWLIVVALTRFVSLGSLLASASLPVFAHMRHERLPYIVFAWVAFLLVWLRHVPNIKRLLAGVEPKIGKHAPIEPPDKAEEA
jgi:glycerol-3-phosphate acyltransferase PlsY